MKKVFEIFRFKACDLPYRCRKIDVIEITSKVKKKILGEKSMKIDCGHEFPSDSSISFTFDLKFSGSITSVRVWTQYHEISTVPIDNENAWHLQCLNITNETTVSD